MEICEAPSLPIEKCAVPPLSWPFLGCAGRRVRSLLWDVVAREQVWVTHCWSHGCCGLLGRAGGRRTLPSSPGVLLMFGSRGGSCWEKRLLSSQEFVSGRELEDARAVFRSVSACCFSWQSAVRGEKPRAASARGRFAPREPRSLRMPLATASPAWERPCHHASRDPAPGTGLGLCATAAPHPLLPGLCLPSLFQASPCLLPPRRAPRPRSKRWDARPAASVARRGGGLCSLPATSSCCRPRASLGRLPGPACPPRVPAARGGAGSQRAEPVASRAGLHARRWDGDEQRFSEARTWAASGSWRHETPSTPCWFVSLRPARPQR